MSIKAKSKARRPARVTPPRARRGSSDESDASQWVERWPMERILPYRTNPKVHTPDAVARLAAVIERVGQLVPIVVDAEGVIAKGHRTRLAMLQLGYTTAIVKVARDVAPTVLRQWRLDDNRLAEDSEWDTELLKLELGELRTLGADLSQSTFAPPEIARLLDDVPLEGERANAAREGPNPKATEEQYLCVVSCRDEAELKSLYDELMERGLSCRLVT